MKTVVRDYCLMLPLALLTAVALEWWHWPRPGLPAQWEIVVPALITGFAGAACGMMIKFGVSRLRGASHQLSPGKR